MTKVKTYKIMIGAHKKVTRKLKTMKKIALNILLALTVVLLSAPRVAADTTTKTQVCRTDAYGQESCSEEIVHEGDEEKVVIKERQLIDREKKGGPTEGVDVTEHEVVDAALTQGQMLSLMAILALGLVGVGYKVRANK